MLTKGLMAARNVPLMLAPVSTFNFASRYQMHRITADRQRLILPAPEDLKLVLPK